MKYLKTFGLTVLASALMALVASGSASATEIDNATGMVANGSTIKAEAESTLILHPPIGDISCTGSQVEGTTTSTGGANETLSAQFNETLENEHPKGLKFSGCNATVTVLHAGGLEIHTGPFKSPEVERNGTLTSSGAEVTIVFAGFHCIFSTNSTDIGTLTGSANTGSTATLDIEATIPRTGGISGAFCGADARWTGSYKFTAPDTLNVT